MSYMLEEIRQQPDILAEIAVCNGKAARALANDIRKRDICHIVLVARGASDNAATLGRYLFELVNGIPSSLAAPSIITLYGARLRFDRTLVIGISQSGKATDVVEYLRGSREAGALTAAITNEPDSELAKVADHSLFCCAGVERSVAATKTYTSALGALYVLSSELDGGGEILEGLKKVPDFMRETLTCEDHIAALAQRYRYMEDCFVIARGLNHATAAETALKMAETGYIGAKPYSAADFMHGPIAVAHEGFPCFLIAPDGKAFDTLAQTADKLLDKKVELVVIARERGILSKATKGIRVPAAVQEIFSPLVYVLVGQLLTYHVALAKGYDPDRPRGLSKVTLTR
ncbi:MAG: SIS domain-containing protein [Armatimonadota bacterium]|nr:SIS domain-containing protein [Armatimonadota bacterium]